MMTNKEAINLLRGLEQSLDGYCELNDDGKKAFNMAVSALELFGNSEQLPSAQPEPQWIPCSERLPDSKEYVLVTDYGETNMGRRFCDRWWLDCCGDKLKDVTAWMPLPEPYREDGAE